MWRIFSSQESSHTIYQLTLFFATFLFPGFVRVFFPALNKEHHNYVASKLCSVTPGEMIQFDEHIFQLGGSTTNYRCLSFFWQFNRTPLEN